MNSRLRWRSLTRAWTLPVYREKIPNSDGLSLAKPPRRAGKAPQRRPPTVPKRPVRTLAPRRLLGNSRFYWLTCGSRRARQPSKNEQLPACQTIAGQKRSGRSSITNGSKLLPGVDGRSPWVRRCKDIIAAHVADLGGIDNVSEAEKTIVRRCAVLTTALERLEVKFAQVNGDVDRDDLDLYQRTAGNLRRLLEAIGLRRRPRDVTVDLQTYLRTKYAGGADAAAE